MLVKHCKMVFTKHLNEFSGAAGFSHVCALMFMNIQENMFLFAQMVGEWLLLYEYILTQTKILLGDGEHLVIHC